MESKINYMSANNPNDVLAGEIAKKLLEEGLIDQTSEKKFIKGISQGNYNESDWKTLLEEIINKSKPSSDEIKNIKH
jgi:hypothetical protein